MRHVPVVDLHSHVLPIELADDIRRRPRAYGITVDHSGPAVQLRRFYFDALTHDPTALRFLIERVGPDRVVVGTDDPFDMGETDPLGALRSVPGLDDGALARIHGLNALELLGETASGTQAPGGCDA